jgi:type II secretion system protein G
VPDRAPLSARKTTVRSLRAQGDEVLNSLVLGKAFGGGAARRGTEDSRGSIRLCREPGPRRRQTPKRGFTLIELLVVVAIIAILAAIAIPNFLEAQMRAKVARIKSDMRTMATALETYAVDHTAYPPRRNDEAGMPAPHYDRQSQELSRLTTPVSYITALPRDILARGDRGLPYLIDYFDPVQTMWLVGLTRGWVGQDWPSESDYRALVNWMVVSVGPDGYLGLTIPGEPGGYPPQPQPVLFTISRVYDPTNGTNSIGNIFRFAGSQDPYLHMLQD